MDAANIDLKAFSERFYKRICGGELAPVLDTLKYIHHETDVWLEITTLLIPGENDSDSEILAMCEWIHDHLGTEVPLHFTAFHPDWKMRDHPPTPLATLRHARALALQQGLKFVYTGNLPDQEGNTTYCGQCGEALIKRQGYTLIDWQLDAQGCCKHCNTPLPGLFEAEPGHWGARRLPVHIEGR